MADVIAGTSTLPAMGASSALPPAAAVALLERAATAEMAASAAALCRTQSLPATAIGRLGRAALRELWRSGTHERRVELARHCTDPAFVRFMWVRCGTAALRAVLAANPAAPMSVVRAAHLAATRDPAGPVAGTIIAEGGESRAVTLLSDAPDCARWHAQAATRHWPAVVASLPPRRVAAVAQALQAADPEGRLPAAPAELGAHAAWAVVDEVRARLGWTPDSVVASLAEALVRDIPAALAQRLSVDPQPALLGLQYRSNPADADFAAVARHCAEDLVDAGLPAYAACRGIEGPVWEWIRDRAQPATLRSLRQVSPPSGTREAAADLAAGLDSGQDPSRLPLLAAWLLAVAPADSAAALAPAVAARAVASIPASRAEELLAAGACPRAVMALAGRWSRPDWSATPLVRSAVVAHGPAEGLAALRMSPAEVAAAAQRVLSPDSSGALVAALTAQDACASLPRDVRRALIVRVSQVLVTGSSARAGLVPWAPAEDVAWLMRTQPAAAARLAGLLARECYDERGDVPGHLCRELLRHTRLNWARVRSEAAWALAADFLTGALAAEPAAWETALCLLGEWAGSLDELTACARSLSAHGSA